MSSDFAIRTQGLSKSYQIYDTPRDRLKQFLLPRIQRLIGRTERNYYQEFVAVKNVSFDVKRGETVGIVGVNGSGKSTLLQLICGTVSPSSGSVENHGRVAALLELGAGFNPDFTGRENVIMNATVLGLSSKEIADRFGVIEAFADIGDFIERPIKMYSSGMVVRLAFAIAINVDPQILIIDEALAVGDAAFQRKCFTKIKAIQEQGSTILFVSHDAGSVVDLCNRALLIDRGEVLYSGTPKRVTAMYHKLLFAADDKVVSIRRQIISGLQVKTVPENEKCELSKKQIEQKPDFNPHLQPKSTVWYETNGALIENPSVLSIDGQNINRLIRGQEYCYSYTVTFFENARNVRFGMQIKTVHGAELGGVSHCADKDQTILADSVVSITMRFNCCLLPGAYFLNAGVLGIVSDEEKYMHRGIDVAMFEVIPEEGVETTGIIDFSIKTAVLVGH